jgi:hypothetical protein
MGPRHVWATTGLSSFSFKSGAHIYNKKKKKKKKIKKEVECRPINPGLIKQITHITIITYV